MMNKAKQKMLEKKGWKVGTAEEFLRLSPVESRYIELKLALSEHLRRRRIRKLNRPPTSRRSLPRGKCPPASRCVRACPG